MEIPKEFIDQNRMGSLTVDIMFGNQLPFVITYGRGVGLTMVGRIPNQTAKQLAHNIKKVLQLYS